jgi:SAM-dependent methyltransferase
VNSSERHEEQSNYFAKAKYRAAADPVVAAYAVPKLKLIEQIVPLSECSVLDVGCVNGVFSLYLKDRCLAVTGTDFSANMLSENPCRRLVQADVAALPFSPESFDVAFEANVLHHVEQPKKVIAEMARASRRWLIFIEPNRNNPVMFLFGVLVKEERALLRSCSSYVDNLLQDCGLTVRLVCCTGLISQNNTPEALVPFLKRFDGEFSLGEYVIAVAEKT